MAPIEINWEEVLRDAAGLDVCFTTPSPAPTAARARAGAAARGKQRVDTPMPRGTRTRLEGVHLGSGAGQRNLRAALQPVAETNSTSKAADDFGCDAHAAALKAFDFCAEDVDGERASRKYCIKKSPVLSGKKNYRQLEMNNGGRPRHGAGDRKPISVDMMYSSKPSCSASFSGHQQRVHALDPEEADHEKTQWSQDHSFSNFAKRRKEQVQGSSSRYLKKVEDVVLLDDEEMLPTEEVDCETSNKQIESKIYYPSRDDPQAVELSSSDIKCLEPGVFLSSPVINYYIQYIKRTELQDEHKFYIFNTYFYSKLEEALVRTSDFLKLRRWWKGVNIFQRSYIMLPIHGQAHWSLIIICIPGKESNSGPIILHLDSLGMHSSTKIFGTVQRFLEEEWRYLKKNPPHDTTISDSVWEDLPRNIHTQIVEVPQQNNAYDCGIFMLYYITQFIREAPERFTSDKLAMFSRSWFNSEHASELRVRIRELLLEEFASAWLDDAISDAALSDSSDEDVMMGEELEAHTPSDTSEMVIKCVDLGDSSKNDKGLKVAGAEEGSVESGSYDLKVAGAEEGSGDSGGSVMSDVGTAEVPTLDEGPTGSIRHDENVDCVLSQAATFSDTSIKDEDPAQACSDDSKDEEEFAIVSPDRLKGHGESVMITPYRDIVDDTESESDDVMIVGVRERRANRQNCLII